MITDIISSPINISFSASEKFTNKWVVLPQQNYKSNSKFDSHKVKNDENSYEIWRQRAINVGICPEDIDKNKLKSRERILKAGLNPNEIINEDSLKKAEYSKELRKTAHFLRLIPIDEAICPPDEFLEQEVKYARDDLQKNIKNLISTSNDRNLKVDSKKVSCYLNAVISGKLPIEKLETTIESLDYMEIDELSDFFEAMPVKKTLFE